MGKFFTSWVLWEKMVFILACAIVVTIVAGLFKLWYDHYRIRKYAALPPKKVDLNREKSIIRSLSKKSGKTPMIEKKPRIIDDGVEIPFGIRAIESGIEVDGVWISRSNTPLRLPSNRGSSAWVNVPNMSTTDVSHRTDLEAGMQSVSSPSSSRPVSRVVMPRAFSQVSITSTTSDPSGDVMAQPANLRYPPHSYSRYEHTRHFRKSRGNNSSENISRPISSYGMYNDTTTQAKSADFATGNASNRSSSIESTHRDNSTSSDGGSGLYDVPVAQPRAVNYGALDMLQAHRLSHAAETGQLVPRSRKPGQSGEWASMANFSPIVSGEIVNFSLPRDSSDLSKPRGSSDFSTPPGSSSSVRSNPFTTPTSGKRSSAEHSEPQSASSEGSYEPLPHIRRASSNLSDDVLREVNSGFSVLKPGTLEAEAQSRARRNGSTSPNSRRRSRSVSIDSETSEKRRSRRLQKRRPSNASTCERASMDSESRVPCTTFSGFSGNWARPPSAMEIARGAEMERNSVVKFSFDAGQRPPSAMEMTRGAELEAGAKYKF